jgi:hypothetical protein
VGVYLHRITHVEQLLGGRILKNRETSQSLLLIIRRENQVAAT